MQLIKKKKN